MGMEAEKFEADGGRNAMRALEKNPFFARKPDALQRVVEAGSIGFWRTGTDLIVQGEHDDHIHFILTGRVEVRVNGRTMGMRSCPDHVGEMSLIEPSEKRSATVRAIEPTVSLRLPEKAFSGIADDHPELWRHLACVLAERLRRRADQVPIPNERPRIFIGSSSEATSVVEALSAALKVANVDVRKWTEDVFKLSSVTLIDLIHEARRSDFGLLIAADDDVTRARRKQKRVTRDNVVLEMGLFIGAVGLERTFVMKEKGVALPSDLNGVTYVAFERDGHGALIEPEKLTASILARIVELGCK